MPAPKLHLLWPSQMELLTVQVPCRPLGSRLRVGPGLSGALDKLLVPQGTRGQ